MGIAESIGVRVKTAGRWLKARSTPWRLFNGEMLRVPWEVGWAYWDPSSNHEYEPEEWDAITTYGKPGDVMIDIGANCGIVAWKMAKTVGQAGRVLAFEPNPRIADVARQVAALNGLDQIDVKTDLIADKGGRVSFTVSHVDGLGVRSSLSHDMADGEEIMVNAVTLDEVLREEPKVDYIKIDVEGAELKVLAGAEETLAKNPIVQIEVHGQYLPNFGDSVEQVFAAMRSRGFRGYNLCSHKPLVDAEFLACTDCHVIDPVIGKDVAYLGYGQVIFFPASYGGQVPE